MLATVANGTPRRGGGGLGLPAKYPKAGGCLVLFKNAFPERATYQILLDGEQLMHTPEAKQAMREVGLRVLPKLAFI